MPEAPRRAWHALDASAVVGELASSDGGLKADEAALRLQRDGPNLLTPTRRRGPLLRFLLQFDNLLIYVLIASSVVTAALGHLVDTLVILGVVIVNAIVGFVQEGKAEKSLDAIRRMLSLSAQVIRDGRRQQLPAESLVRGDVVILAPGDKVPADLRLLSAHNLRIEEAALTGESSAVDKDPSKVDTEVAVGDRACMAHSGTLVVFGQGRGVVVSTGDNTEIGRIGRLLASVEEVETPLVKQMTIFGRWLTIVILALAVLTLAVGIAIHEQTLADMFIAAVGLAVAAIPEGLPAIMTITLAIGVRRMAVRRAIIRRMPAVETLGAVTTVCTDKTGTLTRNEMTVQRVTVAMGDDLEVGGVGYAPRGGFSRGGTEIDAVSERDLAEIARAALLCNDALLRTPNSTDSSAEWLLEGDPTEGALVAMAMKAGLDPRLTVEEFPRLDVIPFESSHQLMATLHHDHQGHVFVYAKGAPERIVERCVSQRLDGRDVPLDCSYWLGALDRLARAGYRVLALGTKAVPDGKTAITFGDIEDGLTLLALVGLIDPPREEAIRAVAQCQSAGVKVKMITGDHAVTASAIACAMGIRQPDRVLTGQDVERLSDNDLAATAAEIDVFARASPEHKLRIVEALQARAEVVAMTGDGVNDSPALKRADVGIAMGYKGTEAAKEAAEMVLADDNFASIAAAIEEGRAVFDNLRKAIAFILPTNGGEAAVLVIAILLGIPLPITPVQILWVNMVTAVTLALALAFEHPESDLMVRPPRRPNAPLIDAFLLGRISLVAILLVLISLGLFEWALATGHTPEVARTAAVNGLVIAEMFYLVNCRNLTSSVVSWDGLLGNHRVLQAIALLGLLQLLFTYAPPMQRLFETAALPADLWGAILVAGLTLFLAVEVEKWAWRRWGNTALRSGANAA